MKKKTFYFFGKDDFGKPKIGPLFYIAWLIWIGILLIYLTTEAEFSETEALIGDYFVGTMGGIIGVILVYGLPMWILDNSDKRNEIRNLKKRIKELEREKN